jgi:hypothetical protein
MDVDRWNITQTNAEIAKDWAHLEPVTLHASCTNNSDLGPFLEEIIADIEKLAEIAIEIIIAVIG